MGSSNLAQLRVYYLQNNNKNYWGFQVGVSKCSLLIPHSLTPASNQTPAFRAPVPRCRVWTPSVVEFSPYLSMTSSPNDALNCKEGCGMGKKLARRIREKLVILVSHHNLQEWDINTSADPASTNQVSGTASESQRTGPRSKSHSQKSPIQYLPLRLFDRLLSYLTMYTSSQSELIPKPSDYLVRQPGQ